MPRSSAVVVENNFSKGLITEATAMNFPENAVTEADNCVFAKNGKVFRRYGIDYETNYGINTFSSMGIMSAAGTPSDYYNNIVVLGYSWDTTTDNGSKNFTVIQFGDKLTFFENTSDNNISGNRKSFTISLSTYQVGTYTSDVGQYIAVEECQFSSGKGYLFVTHPLCNPFYVQYNVASDTISHAVISVKVRDFERIPDGTTNIDDRPTTLTNAHKYNLFNQGWYITARHNGSASTNVLTKWDADRTDFPGNHDIWWAYKDTAEEFNTGWVERFAIGNSPAPNGHYIYSAWLSTRNTAIGVTGLTEFSSGNNRPSCVAFYAGRVWYSGVKSASFNSNIYFSKILETIGDAGTCYQQNDPTDESNADLYPSDGGVVIIPEIADVIRLLPVGGSLYIFATNGIWKISGPDNVFKADDYSVSKISTVPIGAKNSLVVADGTPFFWNKAGIYAIQGEAGVETVVNISVDTIQSLLQTIPNASLPYVKGVFNSIDKTIHWVYNTSSGSNVLGSYTYNKILVLNLVTQSFSVLTVPSSTPFITGLNFSTNSNNDNLSGIEGASVVKYFTVGPIGPSGVYAFTVSQFNNASYLDWFTYDSVGIDFSSYFITGYRVRGELLRKFQTNWLMVMLEDLTNSSCLVQGIWDYSNNEDGAGKYTSSQQIYRAKAARDYSRRKLRIRGSGYSLQYKFFSERGKPFSLVGWSSFDTGNTAP